MSHKNLLGLSNEENCDMQSELYRILHNNDQQELIDKQLESKIQNIEKCLSQRSNFIQMFQNLLTQQLNDQQINWNNQNINKSSFTSRNQQNQHQQVNYLSERKKQIKIQETFTEQKSLQNEIFKKKKFEKQTILVENQVEQETKQKSSVNFLTRFKILELPHNLSKIRQQIQKIKIFVQESNIFLKNYLINQIFKKNIQKIIQFINNKYECKIQEIIEQNLQKQKQIFSLKKVISSIQIELKKRKNQSNSSQIIKPLQNNQNVFSFRNNNVSLSEISSNIDNNSILQQNIILANTPKCATLNLRVDYKNKLFNKKSFKKSVKENSFTLSQEKFLSNKPIQQLNSKHQFKEISFNWNKSSFTTPKNMNNIHDNQSIDILSHKQNKFQPAGKSQGKQMKYTKYLQNTLKDLGKENVLKKQFVNDRRYFKSDKFHLI